MRDPARIDRILERLRALWLAYPDQRLGQLICNLTRDDETGSLKSSGSVFMTEDDELEATIAETTRNGWAPRLKSYSVERKP